jgi:hypothetical protein
MHTAIYTHNGSCKTHQTSSILNIFTQKHHTHFHHARAYATNIRTHAGKYTISCSHVIFTRISHGNTSSHASMSCRTSPRFTAASTCMRGIHAAFPSCSCMFLHAFDAMEAFHACITHLFASKHLNFSLAIPQGMNFHTKPCLI